MPGTKWFYYEHYYLLNHVFGYRYEDRIALSASIHLYNQDLALIHTQYTPDMMR